jgi:hypothetical protein
LPSMAWPSMFRAAGASGAIDARVKPAFDKPGSCHWINMTSQRLVTG